MKDMHLTAVIMKRPKCYIGWVEEIPGANSQAKTKKELIENLKEATSLVLESNRSFAGRRASRHAFAVRIPA